MFAPSAILTLLAITTVCEAFVRVPLTRVQKSLQARDGTNVAMENERNRLYVAEIQVGAQQQSFTVQVDTGSSNLYIPSLISGSCGFDNKFQCQKTVSTGDVTLYYGNNIVTGLECEDTVTLGGIAVQEQYFTVINSCNTSIPGYDGIMGLGFSSFATAFVDLAGETVQPPPVLSNMFKQKSIEDQVFSLYLSNDDGQSQSELTIGGIDPKHYTGNLVYADLVPNSSPPGQRWQVSMQGFSIGGNDVGECAASSCTVVIDSGTSFITIPYQKHDALISALQTMEPGVTVQKQTREGFLQMYSIYTPNISNLKPIIVTIQGQQFMINPADYTMQLGEDNYLLQLWIAENTSHENEELWILGDTFMRKAYTVFDVANKRIGFAAAN